MSLIVQLSIVDAMNDLSVTRMGYVVGFPLPIPEIVTYVLFLVCIPSTPMA
jgi:hypothetical protein